MTPLHITALVAVGIVGLALIFMPSTKPVEQSSDCSKIGATYLYHGLCKKPDGSLWAMP